MASSRQGGCSIFPLLLFLILAMIFSGRGERPERAPEVNPRRPPLEEPIPVPEMLPVPEYGIEDMGRAQDSQGTAFAVSQSGLWLTAEHVTRGCDRVGLATGPRSAESAGEIYQSQVSDAALIADGLGSRYALPLAITAPAEGTDGYHMGFPAGAPAVVHSQLIGPGSAARGPGRIEPVLAWAEIERFPPFEHALSGISGGPTLVATGAVMGINSAASERRGRVLTTRPDAAINLVRAARQVATGTQSAPIIDFRDAVARSEALYAAGVIRQVYCDVAE